MVAFIKYVNEGYKCNCESEGCAADHSGLYILASEVEAEISMAVQVLKKIAEPLEWIKEDAKAKGLEVDYVYAMKLINEPIFYRDTARAFLTGKTR